MPITAMSIAGMISAATALGIASKTSEKQPASCSATRLAGDPRGRLGGAALGAVAAERGGRLRRQPDVAHDRDAGGDDRAGARDGHRAAALELDRVAARLLDEPHRGRHGLLVGDLVGPEREVGDQERRPQAAPGGAASMSISSTSTGTVDG